MGDPALATAAPRTAAPNPTGTSSSLGASLLAAALSLPCVSNLAAQTAPERASVSFKYLDYLDSQPDADRIRVRAPAIGVVLPIKGEWALTGSVVSDSISGASPAYHTSALSKLRDQRYATELNLTRYFETSSYTVGGQFSTEDDYVSRGLSAQGNWSSADKNTTWSLGAGFNRDAIDPTNRAVDHETKRVLQMVAGLTRVLTPHDIVQFNLGRVQSRGYLTDPYKVFDNRPRERDQNTLSVRWNHHFVDSETTLRSSYRYYRDSYGVRAHTLGFEAVQPLGSGWTLMPLLRLYNQSAARFYVDADPSTAPFPPNPADDAVFYSEDQRLSAFGARTWGFKLSKQIDNDWSMDFKLERYEQRGSWYVGALSGGSGSPFLAPFRARSYQLGLTRMF
jgi:Protein of unknown function (DUF3570)